MDQTLFDELQQTAATQGGATAIDRLCARLREQKDYAALFYALLMRKRFELGVSPVPTGSNQDLPSHVHAEFEDGIREAARTVGQLYLDDGKIPQAWAYFRMLGEPAPVIAALENARPGPDDDIQPLIDLAYHQTLLPKKGFEWVLQRYGICSAITSLGGGEVPFDKDTKDYCVKTLIRSLHDELLERLRQEVTRQQGFASTATSIPELIAGRDWLFADDYYHIDLSHLNAVVQMSTQLDPCPELKMARDLCAYGKKLSPRFQFPADPPFDQHYIDYDKFLGILTGDDVEAGLAHFRDKADQADPYEIGTYPAQVLVNLYLRLKRPKDALAVALKHLKNTEEGMRLSCPSLVELCQQCGDYQTLAEVSREQGNPVNFLAGLLAGK